MKKYNKGFTLVELMIGVLIVGVLVMISSAVYTSYIYSARRGEATQTLSSISFAEERYRTNNASYGNLAQVWNGVSSTSGGYYTLSITNTSSTSYTITATATGSQANDSVNGVSCATMTLTVNNGAISKTPSACWPP